MDFFGWLREGLFCLLEPSILLRRDIVLADWTVLFALILKLMWLTCSTDFCSWQAEDGNAPPTWPGYRVLDEKWKTPFYFRCCLITDNYPDWVTRNRLWIAAFGSIVTVDSVRVYWLAALITRGILFMVRDAACTSDMKDIPGISRPISKFKKLYQGYPWLRTIPGLSTGYPWICRFLP